MTTEWEHRRRALLQFFREHRLERGQLQQGHRVVVFVTDGQTAEIRGQGVFFGFRHEALGECIILGTTPEDEDEDLFPERLERIDRMMGRGFILPRHVLEARKQEPERRPILLEAGFLFADGEAYAQLNAITNIPREKPGND